MAEIRIYLPRIDNAFNLLLLAWILLLAFAIIEFNQITQENQSKDRYRKSFPLLGGVSRPRRHQVASISGRSFDHDKTSALNFIGHNNPIPNENYPVIYNNNSALYLPPALQPVTFPTCCKMASAIRNPLKVSCFGVCFTERACNDSNYPYTDIHEQTKLFPLQKKMKRYSKEFQAQRQKCFDRIGLRKPPMKWCRQWLPRVNATSSKEKAANIEFEQSIHDSLETMIDPFSAMIPPPGCSQISERYASGAYQHLLLFYHQHSRVSLSQPSSKTTEKTNENTQAVKKKTKMAFCGIPKVGITQWVQFLRFMHGAKDYLSFPHVKPDVNMWRFDKLEARTQLSILNDPEWKFVIFLREPAERLLSAYLDRIVPPPYLTASLNNTNETALNETFQNLTDNINSRSGSGDNGTMTFEEFVTLLESKKQSCPIDERWANDTEKLKGIDWCTDPHWRPQSYSCGISEYIPRFSYIGSLSTLPDRTARQSRFLLQQMGLWEDFGKYYHWDVGVKVAKKTEDDDALCRIEPPVMKKGDHFFGFQQVPDEGQNNDDVKTYKSSSAKRDFTKAISNNDMPPKIHNKANIDTKAHEEVNTTIKVGVSDTAYGHSTNSRSKLDLYYTPELLLRVKKLYEDDYKLWNLIKDEERMVSGSELAVKLSEECRHASILQRT